MRAPHSWTWGGSHFLEPTVPGDGSELFLNAEAGQITSKHSNAGYARMKGDSWEQGGGKQGWTGQDLFRNHFCSHS